MAKILLLIDEMSQGGAERQLSYLAIELRRVGHDVRLVKFYGGDNFYKSDLEEAGIKTEVCPEGQSRMKRPIAIARLVKAWRPDLTVAYMDGTCMAACLAKLFVRFNLAVSERNTTQVLSRREKMKFRIYSLANHVVPNSWSQAHFIERHAHWLTPKVRVITNMIDTSKFHPASKPAERDVPSVITTARIAPQKNLPVYMDAIRILKDRGVKAHFDWYGRPEYEDYYQDVLERVRINGIGDMVTFHGSSKELPRLYREATMFCLPSTYEGFPNVLCEAMSSGLVCVASDVCDNPDILQDTARRFEPGDAKAIADVLQDALALDERQRQEEGKENRIRIESLCSPKRFLTDYESLIQ